MTEAGLALLAIEIEYFRRFHELQSLRNFSSEAAKDLWLTRD
jgi:hypothetical protein